MTTTAEWVSAYAEATGIAPPSQDDIGLPRGIRTGNRWFAYATRL